MTNELYFFDDNQQLLKILGNEEILENIQKKEITTNKSDLMNDSLSVVVKENDAIQDAAFMAVRENETSFSMYKIISDDDSNNRLSFTGINFAPDELSSYIVKDIRPNAESFRSVAQRLLDFTEGEWSIGYLDSSLNAVTGTFYYVSVKDAMKTLQTLGCEITFSCTVTSSGIEDKQVNFYNQIGKESDMRFDYGSNALEVVRERDRSQIYTSLIGRGKGEEVGDGYGRRIEFTDIEWKKSAGKPLDKPLGQNWLEYPEMTALFGIPKKDGTMRKRENVLVLEDIEDQEELLQATYENLIEYSRPFVQFKTKVLGGDDIGNYVTIHRPEKGYHYRTRVFSVTLDRKTGKVESGLGDNLSGSSSDRKLANIAFGVSELNQNKMNFYDSTEISKWQSDIIRGAKGGSILLMNPEDTGVGNGREPYQMVWMNGPNLDESDHFLVANSEGIGFIDGKWNEANFKTAWTIAGVFNADYIQAGTIRGIDLISLNDDYEIIISNGAIQFKNTKTDVTLGTIFSSDLSVGGSRSTGLYIVQENGYPFGVLAKNSDGSVTDHIVVQPQGYGGIESNQSVIRLNAGQVQVTESLWVTGKIYLNGQELTQGGTGGGGGSIGSREDYAKNMITAEFNVDYDKMYASYQTFGRIKAWGLTSRATFDELNQIIRDNGVSPVFFWAYEGGEGYHSSLSFLNHFYTNGSSYQEECRRTAAWVKETSNLNGSLAWYDAQYPYYTSPADKQAIGNAYMAETVAGMIARVMLQGTAAATWAMFDPDALKGSVNGVQDYGDPFEHQINLIKGWQRAVDYALPVREGTPVTSWFGPRWGTMHNGIDFGAPLGDPIFAAKDGTVVQSMPTSASGGFGEYIIVQHDDGYMSGYAHMTTRMKQIGDVVSQGQQIGTCGSTGDSTGPHLHFSIQTGTWGPYVDPAPFLGLTPP